MPRLPTRSRRRSEEAVMRVRFLLSALLTSFEASFRSKLPMYVYILKCRNKTFYTGITNNLKRRIFEHENGLSYFTKSRLPVNLVYYETARNSSEARRREIVIKDMSQKKKLILIKKFTV